MRMGVGVLVEVRVEMPLEAGARSGTGLVLGEVWVWSGRGDVGGKVGRFGWVIAGGRGGVGDVGLGGLGLSGERHVREESGMGGHPG